MLRPILLQSVIVNSSTSVLIQSLRTLCPLECVNTLSAWSARASNTSPKLRIILKARHHGEISLIIVFVRNQILSVDLFLSSAHVTVSQHSVSHLSLAIEFFFITQTVCLIDLKLVLCNDCLCLRNPCILSGVCFFLIGKVHFLCVLSFFDLPSDVIRAVFVYFVLLLSHVVSCSSESLLPIRVTLL